MKRLFFLLALSSVGTAFAQHQGHTMPMGNPPARPDSTGRIRTDTMPAGPMDHSGHAMHGLNHGLTMDTTMGMTHSLSRHLPMNRNGSGTSWHPDNTPLYALMSHNNPKWSYMLHYAVYARYTSQNVNNSNGRGRGQQFGVPNWVMGMAQRKVGQRGLFQARAMFSLDPLTVGNGGYPLLFQTGETYKDQPLIDKQHPHDLVSELSVSYAHAFSEDIDLSAYVGYPGEPALGPPAFMHRISAFNNPDAPLGHHWQDATHILFGVATLGFRYKWIRLEGSTFKGREPDENRFDFDRPKFDSYSYRLSVNPSPSLALQFSQGFLHSPEETHPEDNVTRTTASMLHSKGLGLNRYVTSAFVWGLNSHPGHASDGRREDSYLAESSLQLNRVAFYGRYENVGKSGEELGITFFDNQGLPNDFNGIFTINNLTLGMNYRLAQRYNTDLVLGAQVTVSVPDRLLQAFYGKLPLSGQVYLRLSPSLVTMRGMVDHRKGINAGSGSMRHHM